MPGPKESNVAGLLYYLQWLEWIASTLWGKQGRAECHGKYEMLSGRRRGENQAEMTSADIKYFMLSSIQLFVGPWTVARQAPLSMGILQARILQWVAMSSSRGSSQPGDQTHISLCLLHWRADALPLVPPGKMDIKGTSKFVNSWPQISESSQEACVWAIDASVLRPIRPQQSINLHLSVNTHLRHFSIWDTFSDPSGQIRPCSHPL